MGTGVHFCTVWQAFLSCDGTVFLYSAGTASGIVVVTPIFLMIRALVCILAPCGKHSCQVLAQFVGALDKQTVPDS